MCVYKYMLIFILLSDLLKESLLEVEGKYRKAMVSNAQLDNEKTNLIYEVDTLKESLMELEEMLSETRRELEEKSKVCTYFFTSQQFYNTPNNDNKSYLKW